MEKSTAKKSLAEIQSKYRERKKAENAEAYLQKERDRWHSRRGSKKVKVIIHDLTERVQRHLRKNWRDRQQKSRLRRKNAEAYSPADSSDVLKISVAEVARGKGEQMLNLIV